MPGIIPQFKKKVMYTQSVEPSNPQLGDSWFDTLNNSIKIYTGAAWSPIWTLAAGIPFGFSMGGYNVSVATSIVDRFDFPFDTGNVTAVGSLTAAKYDGGNTCNSSTHGFFLGGYTTDYISTIERLNFPFHPVSSAVVRGNLTQQKTGVGSCNSSTYGYSFGGWDKATATAVSRMERFAFPFDTGDSSTRGNLTSTTFECGGCNSSNYGYVLGANRSTPNQYQKIQRFQFPFDTGNAVDAGTFNVTINNASGLNSSSAGYTVAATASAFPSNSVYKLPFEWVSGSVTVYTTLITARRNGAACNSTTYGHVMGGDGGVSLKTMERIEFAGDTSISLRGELSGSRWGNVGLDGTDFVGMFV